MSGKKPITILKALSDETRLKILELLLGGEKCVCEIFPKVKRTQSTVSTQLGTLEKAGLIESRRQGKKIFYKIKNPVIRGVFRALGYSKSALLKKNCCMGKKGAYCK
jgi:ArsR family transcriptional regulator